MNITSANLTSAGTLDVRYEPNNTGAVTGFTFSPPEGSEFVCGETYTITAVPKFSGNVLTETFVVSGVDVAGVPRSDNSVLRQGFDSDLTHYGLSLSSLGATILDSSVTSTYLEVVIRLDNDEYAEIDIQPEGGDVFVYPIDNISGGDVPVVLATSITIVVESAITDSGIATAEYSPDNATVQLTYSSSNPNLATINPYTGQITVLADGVVQFCVTDSVSSLSDCKTVTVEKSPEPGVTGITSLTLSVAEEIVGMGVAIPVYSPSDAEVSFVFTSSNPSLATIDSGGNITVLDNGRVTFCVTDELSGLRDCKTVSVRKAKYITNLSIVVDDTIVLYGTASAEYTPSDGTVSLVYTSSDPDIASIDLITGEITVNRTGMVTFCVRDLYTNLTDCKEVYAKGPDTFVRLVYNVTSTSEPTLLFSEHTCCGDKWSDFSNYIYYKGVSITPNTKSYTFPETGEQTVYVDFKTYESNGKRYLNNCIFRDNNKLVKVKFPADYNVQGTGNYTFSGCVNLREADLSCFTEIDYACFLNSSSLTSVTIPNVQIIGESSFNGTDLKNVYGPKVRLIGLDAFKNSLEAAVFPNLLTAEPGAFAYSKLTEFTVPSSTTSVARAFEYCYRLRNLTFEGTTPPGDSFGLVRGLPNLMSVWVPCESINAYKSWLMTDTDSVPLLGYSIRSKVRCKENITTGSTTVTYYASGTSYTKLFDTMSPAVVSITDSFGNEIMFHSEANYRTYTDFNKTGDTIVNLTVDLSLIQTSGISTFTSSDIKSINIPNDWGVGSIPDGDFRSCPYLVSIVLPDSVTTIGANVFRDCTRLSSCTLPNALTSIGNGAFYNCTNLRTITLPETLTSIGESIFEYSGLRSIVIPNSLSRISKNAFYWCVYLSAVTIGDSVTTIEESAFRAISHSGSTVDKLVIPNSVTTIGNGAFSFANVRSFDIGSGIRSIGSYAFVEAYKNGSGWEAYNTNASLEDMTIRNTTPPSKTNTSLYYNGGKYPVYVPSSAVQTYKSTWTDLTSYIRAIP